MNEVVASAEREPIYLPETVELLAGVGNHEAKALFLLYLSENPVLLSSRQMAAGFKEFVGQDTDWLPGHASLMQYCEDSLEPIGSVVEEPTKNARGWARAYTISDYGQEVGVPAVGLLLDWSLRYPDVGLATVLGTSLSPSERRAAEARVELLTELLTADEAGIALAGAAHVRDRTNESRRTYNNYKKYLDAASNAAKTLEKAGIIRLDSVYEANTSMFTIDDPELEVRGGPPRGLVSLAIYDFIAEQNQAGRADFQYEDCLQYVLGKVKQADPNLDPAVIRRKVSTSLSTPGRIKGISRNETFNEGQNTKLFLEEAFRQPLQEICDIVLGLADKTPAFIERGRRAAASIIADPAAKKLLIEKAARFSSYVQSKPVKDTMRETLGLLSGKTPLDLESLAELYKQQSSRPMTPATMADVMRRLVTTGEVVIEPRRVSKNRGHVRNYYSLTQQ